MSKLLLIILDGWGHSDFGDPPDPGNAVEQAQVPHFRALYDDFPRTRLACSGRDVGLPDGQMGNSEVGHLNLGGGRVVHQDIVRIDAAAEEGTLADRLGLEPMAARLRERGGVLHLIGLVSDGGVHSYIRHFEAVLEALPHDLPLRLHCITDGRDTSPTGGAGFVRRIDVLCSASTSWKIATVGGRYWAMDRDKRWERTEKAYDCIVRGESDAWADGPDFLEACYAEGVTDEFIPPTGIRGVAESGIRADDAVILMNFRADRMRQITEALTLPDFAGFDRGEAPLPEVTTMTEYEEGLPVTVAFPPRHVPMGLTEVLSKGGHRVLKVAETEKYAHVTYFFNGGEEEPFPGEDRALIPSPKVATYDLQPEMSARGVADAVLDGIRDGGYDFILVNFANPDMVGHTGVISAAVKAVETVDGCLGELLDAVAAAGDWVALVTADHGNCEKMLTADGKPHTAHTTEPVDFIVYDPHAPGHTLAPDGRLADVAPTVLGLMGITPPPEMTGRNLVLPDAPDGSS
jgi:2,3-bisphosphoglycerate-independent phosphoglycerate mutase